MEILALNRKENMKEYYPCSIKTFREKVSLSNPDLETNIMTWMPTYLSRHEFSAYVGTVITAIPVVTNFSENGSDKLFSFVQQQQRVMTKTIIKIMKDFDTLDTTPDKREKIYVHLESSEDLYTETCSLQCCLLVTEFGDLFPDDFELEIFKFPWYKYFDWRRMEKTEFLEFMQTSYLFKRIAKVTDYADDSGSGLTEGKMKKNPFKKNRFLQNQFMI